MARCFWSLLISSGVFVAASASLADDDPFWNLAHDRAVVADLKLTEAQRGEWHAVLDPLDLQVFPLRNQRTEAAQPKLTKIVDQARAGLAKVLTPKQNARLDAIRVRVLGVRALRDDKVAQQLKLSETQREQLAAIIDEYDAARADLQKATDDKSADELEKERSRISTEERAAVQKLLTADQLTRLRSLTAADFDPAKLGQAAFKAPDLIGSRENWLQSQPLAPDQLPGKVAVVHFFAFGCINCIHNYPSYRKWQTELAGKDVVLVGIHTPETMAERSVETLKGKLKAESLTFPVLVDNEQANWNAWGNNVWPAVYLIDKQGYFRSYWPGELNWQGREGEAYMRKQIDALLAE